MVLAIGLARVRDCRRRTRSAALDRAAEIGTQQHSSYMESLVHPYQIVFENPQTYLCGLIGGFLFAPTTIGAMVWATQFLHQGENLSTSDAASLASTVPIGWIIGCPLLGFISDKIGQRKPVLITGAIVMGLATFTASLS